MADYSYYRGQHPSNAPDHRHTSSYPSTGPNGYGPSSSSYPYASPQPYNAGGARPLDSSYAPSDSRYVSVDPSYPLAYPIPPKGIHDPSALPGGRNSYDYHHQSRSPASPHSPIPDPQGYGRGASYSPSSPPSYPHQYSHPHSPTHGYSHSQEQGMLAAYANNMPLSSSPPYSSDYANSLPRAFTCDTCPLSFHRQHDLKRHEKTHSGSKPYTCNGGCGKTFTRKDALKRHQLVKKCGTFDDSLT